MGRFMIKGTVIEEPKKTVFKSGAVCLSLKVREVRDCKRPVEYIHKIDYSGGYAKELPDDLSVLVGAEVYSIGTITATATDKGSFENLKGEQLIILSFPRFEDDTAVSSNNEHYQESDDDEQNQPVSDDDLPF